MWAVSIIASRCIEKLPAIKNDPKPFTKNRTRAKILLEWFSWGSSLESTSSVSGKNISFFDGIDFGNGFSLLSIFFQSLTFCNDMPKKSPHRKLTSGFRHEFFRSSRSYDFGCLLERISVVRNDVSCPFDRSSGCDDGVG